MRSCKYLAVIFLLIFSSVTSFASSVLVKIDGAQVAQYTDANGSIDCNKSGSSFAIYSGSYDSSQPWQAMVIKNDLSLVINQPVSSLLNQTTNLNTKADGWLAYMPTFSPPNGTAYRPAYQADGVGTYISKCKATVTPGVVNIACDNLYDDNMQPHSFRASVNCNF